MVIFGKQINIKTIDKVAREKRKTEKEWTIFQKAFRSRELWWAYRRSLLKWHCREPIQQSFSSPTRLCSFLARNTIPYDDCKICKDKSSICSQDTTLREIGGFRENADEQFWRQTREIFDFQDLWAHSLWSFFLLMGNHIHTAAVTGQPQLYLLIPIALLSMLHIVCTIILQRDVYLYWKYIQISKEST